MIAARILLFFLCLSILPESLVITAAADVVSPLNNLNWVRALLKMIEAGILDIDRGSMLGDVAAEKLVDLWKKSAKSYKEE